MQFKQHAAWLFILALGMLAAAPYYRGRLPSRNVLMPAEAPLNTPALGVETVLIPPRVALAVIPAADSPNSLIAPNKPAIVVAIPDGAKLASNPPPFDVPPPHLPPMMPVFARRRDFTPSQPLIVEPLREQLSQPEPARERVHRVVDGDSLRVLALRYYGDERRVAEILAANRAVIGDGALLPVGKELVIPPLENTATPR